MKGRRHEEDLAGEAQALARQLAKRFGGRTTRQGVAGSDVEYLIRTTYRGLQCLFMVFATGFNLWIQNARFPKLFLLLNMEGKDNADPSIDLRGAKPLRHRYRDDLKLYVEPGPKAEATAQKFVGENQPDLELLELGRFESLVMGPGQWRLRNQSADPAAIGRRIDAIARMFARSSRPIAPPLSTERRGITVGRGRDTAHRFGGETSAPIPCPSCGKRLCRIASFDATDPSLGKLRWPHRTVEMACCFECILGEASSETVISYAAKQPAVLRQSEGMSLGQAEPAAEQPLTIRPAVSKGLGSASRVGGAPGWIQTDETPDCPSCDQSMRFLAQLASTDYFMFGADMGTAYGFVCEKCKVVATTIQSS